MKATPWLLFGLLLLANTRLVSGQGQGPKPEAVRPKGEVEATKPSPEEKAIRAAIDAFVAAFAKGDAPAIAALFTEQGEAIDTDGAAIRGRKALEAHYAGRFAADPGERIETTVDLIHFLAPEVARHDGRSKLIPAVDGLPATSRYTSTFVKIQDRWLIASIRELDDSSITHHERLKELEWMIGEWVEETGESRIMTKVAWSDDENYLLRSFEVHVAGKPEVKGTQRIGWDPLTKQIKSWVFDSRGGYGDGHWTYRDDHWVIKSSGVRPDGVTTSATQFLKRVAKDRMVWRSTDRTIGSETGPEEVEVTMVRKPPEPK